MIIDFKSHIDNRGTLTVIEKEIPFEIKRIFYIYNIDDSKRGFHKHKKTRQIAICLKGACTIVFSKNGTEKKFNLHSPEEGLLIEPDDYHWMEDFSKDSILLVIASEYYDEKDYIKKM